MSDYDVVREAVRRNIARARSEGYEFEGAEPPGNPWARAYAEDCEMLLDLRLPNETGKDK